MRLFFRIFMRNFLFRLAVFFGNTARDRFKASRSPVTKNLFYAVTDVELFGYNECVVNYALGRIELFRSFSHKEIFAARNRNTQKAVRELFANCLLKNI